MTVGVGLSGTSNGPEATARVLLVEDDSLLVTGPDLVMVDVTETEFIGMSVLGGLVSLDRDVKKRGGQFRLQGACRGLSRGRRPSSG